MASGLPPESKHALEERSLGRPPESVLERTVGRAMVLPRTIIGALILVSIALNFANVIGRYVFFTPIVWAEEVMIFIMIWCVFVGAILVTWDNRHLRMDLLSQRLKSPWKEALNTIVQITSLALFAFVAIQSWTVVSLFARLGQKSDTAAIPMMIPHFALFLGFALMFIAALVRSRLHILGGSGSEIDEVVDEYGGGTGTDAPR